MNSLINFLKSPKFFIFLLIASTIIEGLFAFKLFMATGYYTFEFLLLPVALCYSFIMSGIVVGFTLRHNITMIWIAIIFELVMNFLLEVMAILLNTNSIEHRYWIFAAQFLIGTLLPLATKSFAEEINPRERSAQQKLLDDLQIRKK